MIDLRKFKTNPDNPRSCREGDYGLDLISINPFSEPIPARGAQGIWYFNLDTGQGASKAEYLKRLSNA